MMCCLRKYILLSLLPVTASLQAQDANELAALRKAIEQQTVKIEALSAQVARLSAQLANSGATPTVVTDNTPSAPVPPVAKPVAPASNTHIVVKGESLEKIAKQYGVAVSELLKINKITDPKKLQIGQQLTLPPGTEINKELPH
jgi:LysM repeat protein